MKTIGLLVSLALLAIPTAAQQRSCVESTRQVFLMGTPTALTSCAASREAGLAELETFIRILETVEGELSTWRPDSAISKLNRQPVGVRFPLTTELSSMFEALFFWYQRTDRTFDPGVGALTEAWGIHKDGQIPSQEQLQSALQRSGLQHLSLDAKAREITRTRDVTVDVGGFGKGEGLDRVLRYAQAHGSAPFLIDLGGQFLAYGRPSGKSGWEVDLADPLERQKPTISLTMTEGSLSTSAGSERDVIVNGRRIGHIIDPRTGEPVVRSGSVTVWHASALVADILSTALFVMGPDAGIAWADKNEVAAIFQLPDPKPTRAWKKMLDSKSMPTLNMRP
jgi:thiamine biosynthesis lipoprotein